MIDPGGFAQRNRFAGANHGNAEQHVVAHLHGLTGGRPAGADHLFSHGQKHWLGAVDGSRVAARHKGQRAGLGARHPAGDRRIDQCQPALSGFVVNVIGCTEIGG